MLTFVNLGTYNDTTGNLNHDYFSEIGGGDFNYAFYRGTDRYMVLLDYPLYVDLSGDLFEYVSVWKSTDNGITWAEQDLADAPFTDTGLGTPYSPDVRFNAGLPAATPSAITVAYDDGSTAILSGGHRYFDLKLADYTFSTDTWGTPYAIIPATVDWQSFLMSSRPDGKIVLVYLRANGAVHSIYYTVWDGIAWSPEAPVYTGQSSLLDILVDANNTLHVLFLEAGPSYAHIAIDSAGGLTGPYPLPSRGPSGNLRMLGGELIVPSDWDTASSGGGNTIGVLRSGPIASPSWTFDECLPSRDLMHLGVAYWFDPATWSLLWVGHPPGGGNLDNHIWISTKNNGVWSAATKIWDMDAIPPPAPIVSGGAQYFSPVINPNPVLGGVNLSLEFSFTATVTGPSGRTHIDYVGDLLTFGPCGGNGDGGGGGAVVNLAF